MKRARSQLSSTRHICASKLSNFRSERGAGAHEQGAFPSSLGFSVGFVIAGNVAPTSHAYKPEISSCLLAEVPDGKRFFAGPQLGCLPLQDRSLMAVSPLSPDEAGWRSLGD